MSCHNCGRSGALRQVYGPDATLFVGCLLQKLGLPADGKWTPAAHAALYDRAASVINLRNGLSPEAMRLEAFGSNPQRAAEIAANWPTSELADIDPFWTCLTITRSAAVASMTSKSGDYWNVVVAAGAMIADAEGGSVKVRPRGSLLAAGLTLFFGASGILLWGGKR